MSASPGSVPLAASPGRPRRPAGRGLLVTGIALLVLSLAAGVLVAVTIVRMLPLDVIGRDGTPGSSILAVVPAGGEATVDLEAGQRYSLLLATGPGDPSATLGSSDIRVTGPSGQEIAVAPGQTSLTVSVPDWRVVAFAEVLVPADGEYRIEASQTRSAQADAAVLVRPADRPLTIVQGVFGSVALAFAAAGAGIVGIVLTVIGGVQRHSSTRRR